jgi:branched-subunit amino acid ABC-type transport system permease component
VAYTLGLQAVVMGVLVAFVALGYSLLYGVLRVINFAHTDVIAVAGLTCVVVAPAFGGVLPVAAAVVICLAVGAAFGLASAMIVHTPFGQSARFDALLASFCFSLVVRAVLTIAFGSATRRFPLASTIPPTTFAVAFVATAAAIVLCLRFILTRTLFGLAVRAYGSDRDQVASLGYPVRRIAFGTFALAGTLGGLTAIPISVANGVAPDIGTAYGLWAFAATVLGGLGRIRGTLAGGVLLGVGLTIAASRVSPLLVNTLVFAAMAAVLALRPQGLFGYSSRRV